MPVYGIHDYTIEVCIICGAQLGRGTASGRCINRDHWSSGGMIVRVKPRPFEEQADTKTIRKYWYIIKHIMSKEAEVKFDTFEELPIIILTAQKYVEYLDSCIRFWRQVRDGEVCPPQDETRDIAKYYIDALQSSRTTLTGDLLDCDEILHKRLRG